MNLQTRRNNENEKMCGWKRLEKIERQQTLNLLLRSHCFITEKTHRKWLNIQDESNVLFLFTDQLYNQRKYYNILQNMQSTGIKWSLYVHVLQMCRRKDEQGKLWNYKKLVCFHLQRIKFKASSWEQKNTIYYILPMLVCPADTKSFHSYLSVQLV